MKSLLQIVAVLVLFLGGCAHRRETRALVPPVTKQVTTEAGAIAIVVADIEQRGGNARREECSAQMMDGDWWVTAWHILYPNNVGSSRFVPGGFTTYVVSTDGRILRTLPGL